MDAYSNMSDIEQAETAVRLLYFRNHFRRAGRVIVWSFGSSLLSSADIRDIFGFGYARGISFQNVKWH
jgi:hypothetical protein